MSLERGRLWAGARLASHHAAFVFCENADIPKTRCVFGLRLFASRNVGNNSTGTVCDSTNCLWVRHRESSLGAFLFQEVTSGAHRMASVRPRVDTIAHFLFRHFVN